MGYGVWDVELSIHDARRGQMRGHLAEESKHGTNLPVFRDPVLVHRVSEFDRF